MRNKSDREKRSTEAEKLMGELHRRDVPLGDAPPYAFVDPRQWTGADLDEAWPSVPGPHRQEKDIVDAVMESAPVDGD